MRQHYLLIDVACVSLLKGGGCVLVSSKEYYVVVERHVRVRLASSTPGLFSEGFEPCRGRTLSVCVLSVHVFIAQLGEDCLLKWLS